MLKLELRYYFNIVYFDNLVTGYFWSYTGSYCCSVSVYYEDINSLDLWSSEKPLRKKGYDVKLLFFNKITEIISFPKT